MLKIKDGTDLEQLKKYGFKKEYHGFKNPKVNAWYYHKGNMIIWDAERIVCLTSITVDIKLLDDLYDLIQDGIIVKV